MAAPDDTYEKISSSSATAVVQVIRTLIQAKFVTINLSLLHSGPGFLGSSLVDHLLFFLASLSEIGRLQPDAILPISSLTALRSTTATSKTK